MNLEYELEELQGVCNIQREKLEKIEATLGNLRKLYCWSLKTPLTKDCLLARIRRVLRKAGTTIEVKGYVVLCYDENGFIARIHDREELLCLARATETINEAHEYLEA